jgi:protocadherin Fat 1/2/3
VIIHLIDENDNYPIIDFYPNDLQTDSNTLKIFLSEFSPIKTLILSLSIIDQDSGDNGRVTWKLDRSSLIPFELIRLTETTGELRTTSLLDREYISEYYFTLEATDHGRPKSKSTRINIHIFVLDENDNTPKFRQENLKVMISEHVKLDDQNGYEVYHIYADDFDQGLNGEIVYSIMNNDNNLFKIDSKTGIIRAMAEFDRKQQDTYVLRIQAQDKGIESTIH